MHSQVIIRGYRRAMNEAIKRIKEISVKLGDKDEEEKRDMLKKWAMTSLNSKLILYLIIYLSLIIIRYALILLFLMCNISNNIINIIFL